MSLDDANDFWDVLCNGKAADNSQPIEMLRARMIDVMAASGRGTVMTAMQRAGLTIRSWNAWVTGSEIGLLRWAPQRGEKFPVLIDPNDL
jgi:hypothetical protein